MSPLKLIHIFQGRIQRFWKGVALYVGHHGWPTKKILDFRWSKKAKITLETISFWQNISISIFKFSPFLYTTKACQWISSIFQNLQTLWWGRRKNTQQSMKKEKLRKVVCFIKSFKMIMNHFFVSQAHSQPDFCFFKSEWRKKYQKAN